MKRFIISLLALFQLLSLAACSGRGSKNSNDIPEIDAVTISEQIVPLRYSVIQPEQNDSFWFSDALSGTGDAVYSIGNDSGAYHIFRYDIESSLSQILYSSADSILTDLAVSPEGEIYALSTPLDESAGSSIIKMDSAGNQVESHALDGLHPDGAWSPKEIEYLEGTLYLLDNAQLTAVALGSDISVLYSVDVEANAKITVSAETLILGQDKNGKFRIYTLNTKNHTLEETAVFNLSFARIGGGRDWDLYLDDNSNLYGYRFEDHSFEKLFSWSGLSITGGAVIDAGEGKLICSGKISFADPNPLLTLVPREVDESEPSTILIATTSEYGLDYRIQEAIRQWNLENPQYPIEVINYSLYNSGSDNRAAEMRLATDIISGKIPDIYDFSMTAVDTIPSAAQYARRGLLEDLYPYMDSDPEISRSDFLSGVLKSLEINGCLYELVPEYSLITTFASAKDVGDKENWTYQSFNSIIEQSSYYDSIFDKRNDRMFMLGNIIDASGKQLVDWSAGECYFNSEYFKNLLETVKKMPEKGAERVYPLVIDEMKYSTGLLYFMNMRDLWMASSAPSVYGEDYALVGLPEVGNVIYPLCSFGISAYSENKQQCWEFLRQFMTEEYNTSFFMSPRLDGIQEQMEQAWKNVEDVADVHPYGRAVMQDVIDILKTVDTAARHDAQIWQIVYSEVGAYFAGDKSTEETAAAIQSRVSLYMAEQS